MTVPGLARYAELELLDRIQDGRRMVYALTVWLATGPEGIRRRIDQIELNNKKWVSVVPRAELSDFRLTGSRAGPPGHFDLVLGTRLQTDTLERLAAIFGSHERRNRA